MGRLTDAARGRSNEPFTVDVDLREPLAGSDVRLLTSEPTSWPIHRQISRSVRVSNETDAGNSVVGDVRIRLAGRDDWTDLSSLLRHLPLGRVVEV